ncbi:MAG TPA: hypothetical protein DDW50_09475 [Firmicutes bacterium]|jgi:hypothetical protein|nr:hypothetical protein [Bacillota bacterium]
MGKFSILVLGLGLTLFAVTYPVLAQTPLSSTDRKLNELSNRVASLDSTWGRFQIGGGFELDTTSNINPPVGAITPPNFNQQLSIALDANVDPNLQLSLRISQLGDWGSKYQDANSNASPVALPSQVDQAFLKLSNPSSIDYLGRFQFSLGPIGMMADFFANPVEGVAIQKDFQKFHVIGVYSRVNTQYQSGTTQIANTEDYVAARIGWTGQDSITGINIIPGVSGETDFSIDYAKTQSRSKFATELGWYSFASAKFPDYKVAYTPGILLSYANQVNRRSYLQIKAGYLGPQFLPLYSSLAHSSGELREWFIPNSQGVEFYLLNGLSKGYSLENRCIMLTPVTNYNQPDFNYRWRCALIKHFSPVNQLQAGFDLKSYPDNIYRQLFVNWILQF